MDFDPSAFLSMDMTEDQDAVYTAPDVPPGYSPAKVPPPGKIVVEGGLQMEQNLQIPVPVFGLLQQAGSEPDGEADDDTAEVETTMQVDTTEHETTTTPQPSPGERTSSPVVKKIIPTSHEETRFRKELFSGHFDRVKLFRLHCSICDRHLGCAPWHTERQMRMHKLLNVVVCRKCFEFYGDINFPIEDGSELYCCWCGEGGECFCCSTCPKIVCKKCVKRNFGAGKVKEIDENDDWSCFVCKPEDIWPHRALMWGLQRWSKGMRQMVVMLSKEDKQARLQMDTSHCCLKGDSDVSIIGLPQKNVLSKVPLSMIALPYQVKVRGVLTRPDTYSSVSNGVFVPNSTNYTKSIPAPMPETTANAQRAVSQNQHQLSRNMVTPQQQQHQSLRTMIQQQQIQRTMAPPQQIHRTIVQQEHQIPRHMVGYHVRQVVQRHALVMNRPGPYPMNRNMPPLIQAPPPLQPFQYAPRQGTVSAQASYRPYHQLPMAVSTQPAELIDLETNNVSNHRNTPVLDISSLENGIRDVKKALQPTLTMLDQFDTIRNDLTWDVDKLMSFSDKLSYGIKIAICNLAKANTDLIESQRKIIDSRVSSVVNNIQSAVNVFTSNGMSSPERKSKYESSLKGSNPLVVSDSSPEIIEVNPNSPSKTPEPNPPSASQTPATPLSSTGEEGEDLAIAMLCETVLEVEDNKENKDDANKDQVTPVKRSQAITSKPVKGRPRSRPNNRMPRDQIDSSDIQVIDLVDDEDNVKNNKKRKQKFDESYWLKKFNIVPCKVLLKKIPKA